MIMNTQRTYLSAKILGILVGVGLGIWIVSMIGQQASDDRAKDDCIAAGGSYRHGDCRKTPTLDPLMQREGPVCLAMKGSYVVTEDKGLTCYSDEGKEIELPNLEGKEVIILDDATVVLRDEAKR